MTAAMTTPDTPEGAQPLLSVKDLVVMHRTSQGDSPILDGVDLTVEPGEAVAIVGESGSGKSMLAKAVVGLLPPGVVATSGGVHYNGEDLLGLDKRKRASYRGDKMTLLFQDPFTSLNPLLRTGDHIVEGLQLSADHKIGAAEGRREAVRRLAEVGIDGEMVVDRYPFQLSGGMRQRVALAAALARDPALLLADEPSTALDVTTQAEILELIKETQRARGMGLIFISHDLRVAFSVCDRVYVLYGGTVMETGRADNLLEMPLHPYTLGLLLSEPTAEGRQAELHAIDGSVPRPGEVTHQCSFADRCKWVRPECTADKPPLLEISATDMSRCLRLPEIREEMRTDRVTGKVMLEVDPVPDNDPVIASIRDLKKVFSAGRGKDVVALDGVSLDLRRGESVGLVGESGSGKTTIARCLIGLEIPTEGTIELYPRDTNEVLQPLDRKTRRFTQIVFQDPYSSLNPRQKVGSALREVLRVHGKTKEEATTEAKRLLDAVGLPASYLDRRPNALSGGERQRVAIARALSVSPELLICDEPVSALDVSIQAQILELFRDLREEFNVSLLFITHDMGVVRQVADTVHILYEGRAVESGPVAQVLDTPQHEYTQKLIASIPGEHVT